MDNKDWTAFRNEYREDVRETRKELKSISGSVEVLANEMTHKVADADLIPAIDKRLHFHKRDCNPGNEPSQVIEVPAPVVVVDPPPENKKRLDIDWPKTIRNAIYLAAVSGAVAGAIIAAL